MAAANSAAKAGAGAKPPVAASFPGMPGFKDPSERNAKEFLTSMVKNEYLNGFKLPDMTA